MQKEQLKSLILRSRENGLEKASLLLKGRRVSDQLIEDYEIGYLTLEDILPLENEFPASVREGKSGFITFPVTNTLGRDCGILLRSVENKIYCKLFLEEAKVSFASFGLKQQLKEIFRQEEALLVEGPWDVLSLKKIFPDKVIIPLLEHNFSSLFLRFARRWLNSSYVLLDRDLETLSPKSLTKSTFCKIFDWRRVSGFEKLQDVNDFDQQDQLGYLKLQLKAQFPELFQNKVIE